MALSEKRVAVLVEEAYQEMEIWYPYYRLKEAGVDAVLVGTGKPEYKSKVGYPCKPHTSIDDIKPADFDGVIIPGGWAPDFLRRFEAVNRFVAAMDRDRKLVAAICHGGWGLSSAQILQGRHVTSFFAIRHDMEHAGATWTDAEVVIDGNLVTARCPDDLPAFMRAILVALEK